MTRDGVFKTVQFGYSLCHQQPSLAVGGSRAGTVLSTSAIPVCPGEGMETGKDDRIDPSVRK